jgi:hypothetical protein
MLGSQTLLRHGEPVGSPTYRPYRVGEWRSKNGKAYRAGCCEQIETLPLAHFRTCFGDIHCEAMFATTFAP